MIRVDWYVCPYCGKENIQEDVKLTAKKGKKKEVVTVEITETSAGEEAVTTIESKKDHE